MSLRVGLRVYSLDPLLLALSVWLKLWSLSVLFLLLYLPALVHCNLWNNNRKNTEKGTAWSKTKAGKKEKPRERS